MPSSLAHHWDLDPEVAFLNHGSFGACPRVVREARAELLRELEREPVRFYLRRLPELWDEARRKVAGLVGARPKDLAFVPNATFGVNTVLAALDVRPGDEVVVTDHGYHACTNAAARWVVPRGGTIVTATLPFEGATEAELAEAVLGTVTERTRLLLVDHVTSPTGLVLPIERIVREAQARGARVLVDGAHAVGMLDLDLTALGADYYTSNAHKWLCAPKVSALLHVREDRQAGLHALVTSHGYDRAAPDRPQFQVELDWMGTLDPTPTLAIPAAIRFLQGILPGGLAEVRARNHALAVEGRRAVLDALGTEAPVPASLLGSLASVPVPGRGPCADDFVAPMDPLHFALSARGFQLPVYPFGNGRLLRLSAQLYNAPEDYARLAEALAACLAAE